MNKMKRKKFILLIVILVCSGHLLFSNSLSQHNTSQYQKAMDYINNKGGEVYIKFFLPNSAQLCKLDLSIDKVIGPEVFAYLNKREFLKFLDNKLPYEVLTHPGDLLPNPRMSDYSDRENYEFDRYPTYEGYLQIMEDFTANHPDFCRIIDIGESVEGRKLLVAKISDKVDEREKEPRYYLSATVHGDETLGYILALNLIDLLLTTYNQDERIRRIVDSAEVWICPLMNPDGTYRSGNSTVSGARRYNANGQDLNRDFPDPVEGLYPNGTWQKETENFVTFESEYDFVMTSDVHGGTEVACYPWGCHWTKLAADDEWWKLTARNYADLAQENSPSGYFTAQNDGIVNGYQWYPVVGGRMSYMLYFRHSRLLTLELSNEKLLSESELNNHWDYNRDALLGNIEEIFNGIRGTVTDSLTGEGVRAKVFIKNFDKDSSFVYANDPHGDYYRPIFKGTYDVEFSHVDYYTKVITGVSVENGKPTILDVQLRPLISGIDNNLMQLNKDISITQNRGNIIIYCPDIGIIKHAAIYSVKGKMVKQFKMENFKNSKTIIWDGKCHSGNAVNNGCYIFSIHTLEKSKAYRFFFLRNYSG